MKIKVIQQLCKNAKRIIVFNDEGQSVQWISDGYCIFPLLNLPRLTRDNIFALFDIPVDKQGSFCFEERDELPRSIDFGEVSGESQAVMPMPYRIQAFGKVFSVIDGSQGYALYDRKYLAAFDEDAMLFERVSPGGHPYIVAREGMFIAGVISPFLPNGELAEWLVNTGENLIVKENLIVGTTDKSEHGFKR